MKSKKVIILSIAVVLVVIIGVVAGIVGTKFILSGEDSEKDYTQNQTYIEMVNDTYGVDIILYGDVNPFNDELKYRKILELSEDKIMENAGAKLKVLVITDINEELKISDEEFLTIKSLAEEKGLDMIYYGERHLKTLEKLKFGNIDYYSGKTNSFAYNGSRFAGCDVADLIDDESNIYAEHRTSRVYDKDSDMMKWDIELDALMTVVGYEREYGKGM